MAKRQPPPLPPRQSSTLSIMDFDEPPPSYDSIAAVDMAANATWAQQDQRSTSMESLVPAESNQQNERRRLLLIYIHGFMGNETSFRSFPAHVHHLLTALLVESHVVHTKIYPRYRSKRNISFARDDFSSWLEPHEDPKTDVVLLGHSMGGLLAAEVAIMPPAPPASRPLKHRILGTINFDVPYLGMHPGIIRSGLASIFNPADKTQEDIYSQQPSPVGSNDGASSSNVSFPTPPHRRSDGLWTPAQGDPNYDPSFNNDVVLPVRKGWRNAWHFVNKHSGELRQATKQLVTSHMEFGGAMANYGELKARYARIRALEEEDGAVRRSVVGNNEVPSRVRFINYYTASTGRPKKPKAVPEPPSPAASDTQSSVATPSTLDLDNETLTGGSVAATRSSTPSPRISLEEYRSDGSIVKDQPVREDEAIDGSDWEDAAETLTIGDAEPMTVLESRPIDSDDEDAKVEIAPASPPASTPAALSPTTTLSSTVSLGATLPPIADLPPAPPPLDVSYIEDPGTRKLVAKEHTRAVKAYEKSAKDREKAIVDRAKLQAKRERETTKKDVMKMREDAEKVKRETDKAKKDAEKAKRDVLQAEQKAAKLNEKQRKQAEKELTQSEKEAMRLDAEKQRMEAEARRMRGEGEPEVKQNTEDHATNDTADEDFPDPPEQELSSEHIPDPPEERLSSRHNPDPPEQSLSTVSTRQSGRSSSSKAPEKDKGPPKDRMFCMLPPKDSHGQRDPCWVRIFMKNVDEVGAHCGLFFVDERYERLVGDVGERIEGWVHEGNDDYMAIKGR
ncbi:hypothetical protein LTR36_009531 [Oleoguttula mirabilis]|uniref:AB hydrolase-1 domain-containing protein n=1 Tax=Oleoguttula mirabilis TaxID=1507867 RepID=A0AAV9JU70_9PEZI|nr:hypothetical protein LTR36_009531 [Oleoguttula mirabilis]